MNNKASDATRIAEFIKRIFRSGRNIRHGFGFEVLPSDDLVVVPRSRTTEGAIAAARASFENTRRQAAKAGCTDYRWLTCKDSDVCEKCRKHDGKRFRFSESPAATGYPGDGRCCPDGLCRCYAEPIV